MPRQAPGERPACRLAGLPALLLGLVLAFLAAGCLAMTNSRLLDTSKYFVDPKVAAFVDAVQRGDAGRVQRSLSEGISPNAKGIDGFRPIHFAFAPASAAVLELLLAAGADPSAPLTNMNQPLHFAVRQADPQFTRLLLRAKADPNARGDARKPVIFTALPFGHAAVIEDLVRGGADINGEWASRTPFMSAVGSYNWPVATLLLKLGADPRHVPPNGTSALESLCEDLGRLPVDFKDNKVQIRALLAALAERGVDLPCKPQVQRW